MDQIKGKMNKDYWKRKLKISDFMIFFNKVKGKFDGFENKM